MDKGVKKLQKHIDKIEQSNKTIVDKNVKRVLKLKNKNLSGVKHTKTNITEILIHKDTNNFPILKQQLLSYCNEIHKQYPFISIGYDTLQTNGKHRQLKADNGNRLLLTINWNDYMQYVFKESGQSIGEPIPSLGMESVFSDMKLKNLQTLNYALKDILKKVKESASLDHSDYRINLLPKSMSHEITRNHIMNIGRKLNQQYNGVIEILNVGTEDDCIILRVHWNIYIAQLAAKEESNKVVELESFVPPINVTSFNEPVVHTPIFDKEPLLPDEYKTSYPVIPSENPETTPKKIIKKRKKVSVN